MEVVVSLSLRQLEHALPRPRRRPDLVTRRLRDCGVLVKGLCKHILIGLWTGSCDGDSGSKPPTTRARASGSSGGRQHGHLNKTLWDQSSFRPLTHSWTILELKRSRFQRSSCLSLSPLQSSQSQHYHLTTSLLDYCSILRPQYHLTAISSNLNV